MKSTTRQIGRVAAVATIALGFVACGGSGDDSSAQDQVADLVIAAASNAGASPDGDCIRAVAEDLSDTDADKLVDSGIGPDAEQPDISTEASEILAEMLLC